MADPRPGQQGLVDAFWQVETSGDYGRATIEQALVACEDVLPQAFSHDGDDHGPDSEMALELAECLREQGLDVSDDLFSGEAVHEDNHDELNAAMETCRAGG